MTKSVEELKALVQEVRKLATPFTGSVGPVSPSSPVGHSYTPEGPSNSRGPANIGKGTAGIVDMQKALIGLAKDVSSQINLAQVNSQDPREQQEAKGRDAFGVFLTKNYMRNSHVAGVQFDPDPKATELSQKNPQAPTRMSLVMDTMNRIGGPLNKNGGEFSADGKWGPRTNAAVHNAYAFASGLFDFIDDINRFAPRKIVPTSYTKQNLQQLGNIAQTDPNSVSQQEKIEFAPAVAAHVRAIQNMYHEVKSSVLEHPAYMQFIQEDAPFQSYQAGTILSSQQLDSLKKKYPDGFQISVGPQDSDPTMIGIDNLSSLQSLQDWMSKLPSKVDPTDVINQVSQQAFGKTGY